MSLLGGGETHFGVLLGVTQSAQDNINSLINRANYRAGAGPITTGTLTSGYELAVQFGYRLQGSSYALIIRPSYFTQSSNGSGTDGSYNYGVSGLTLFPILRLTPLENDFMKFFMNIGVGYGTATTKIEEASAKATAVGSAFGSLVGLGAEFCLTASSCFSVEGNYRYLLMERNLIDSTSGTFNAGSGIYAPGTNKELELDGFDFQTRMSGLQFLFGYILHY